MSEVALESGFLGVFGLLERDGCVLLAANRRVIDPGTPARLVHDLPGGRVEEGETLTQALAREWQEECNVEAGVDDFLFVQEGIRFANGVRRYVWRSFFFRVHSNAEPLPGQEIESLLWLPRHRLAEILDAPYHAGFLRWLDDGAAHQVDEWH